MVGVAPIVRSRAFGRGLARLHERAPQEEASTLASAESAATTTSSPMHQAVSTQLPVSMTAVACVASILGAIILGIAIWRIRAWRRRRREAPSSSVGNYFEKKHGDLEATKGGIAPVYFPALPRASSGATWVPQIKNVVVQRSDTPTVSKKALEDLEKRPKVVILHQPAPPPYDVDARTTSNEQSGIKAPLHRERRSPPPFVPLPMPPHIPTLPPLPPTPPAAYKKRSSAEALMQSPVRTTSAGTPFTLKLFLITTSTRLSHKSTRSESRKLPRLMVVASTFAPRAADELLVSNGEVLRLLEEFEDEWCLVQRVGGRDAEKGVIPRFCLVERQDTLSFGQHKRAKSVSSVSSQGSRRK